jgi:tetratricopeptide (TPR) repeat protein
MLVRSPWVILARSDRASILEDTLTVCRAEDEHVRGYTESTFAFLAEAKGDPGECLVHAERGVSIAERVGSAFSRVFAYGTLGSAHLQNQNFVAAVDAAGEALATLRQAKAGVLFEPYILNVMAMAHYDRAELGTALEAINEAVDLAQKYGTRVRECAARLDRARLLAQSEGDVRRIEEDLAVADGIIKEINCRRYWPHIGEFL